MIRFLFAWILMAFFLVSCETKARKSSTVSEPEVVECDSIPEEEVIEIDSSIHYALGELNLVDVNTIDSTIHIDLKYATSANFMGFVLYDTFQHVFLQRDVAIRLSKCQKFLKDTMPQYSLLVYDGVRPLEVQRQMWNALDSIPTAQRGKFVSNPAFGSVHNFGAAVDLTICGSLGHPIDMGAGYDDFRDIAFPSKEWQFLKSGELSTRQWQNRKLLRMVMRSQGFRNIPSEWWHFNACSRETATATYPKLLNESGDQIHDHLTNAKKESKVPVAPVTLTDTSRQ